MDMRNARATMGTMAAMAVAVMTAAAMAACAGPATSAGQLTAFSQTPEPCADPCTDGGWNGYKATVDVSGHIAMRSTSGGATAVGTLTQLGAAQLAGLIETLPIDEASNSQVGSGVTMGLDIDFHDGGAHSYAASIANPGFFGGFTELLSTVAVAMMDDSDSDLVGGVAESE